MRVLESVVSIFVQLSLNIKCTFPKNCIVLLDHLTHIVNRFHCTIAHGEKFKANHLGSDC